MKIFLSRMPRYSSILAGERRWRCYLAGTTYLTRSRVYTNGMTSESNSAPVTFFGHSGVRLIVLWIAGFRMAVER
jgi:hypothetical protein